jgi:hypothetical protein
VSENDTQRTNRPLSVFISYSRSDSVFVSDLANWLREAGCTVWQDTSGLRGGQTWASGIDQAVRVSEVFIVVLSPASSTSEWVRKETLLAMKVHKPIVPILFRDTEVPVQLVDLQFVDFRGERKEARQKLFEAISTVMGAEVTLNTPIPSRRYGKPLALSLLGAIILGTIVYLTLYKFFGKTSDTGSTSNQSVSVGRSPSPDQPKPTPSPTASVAPTTNPALGTFTTSFRPKEKVDLAFGYTLGNQNVCFFHNLKLGEQDVGKLLKADAGPIEGPQGPSEESESVELKLYRSLVGPWKGGQSISMFEKQQAEVVDFKRIGPQELSWKVTQPGSYVLCLEMQMNQYEDFSGKPLGKVTFARYTVLLSGN